MLRHKFFVHGVTGLLIKVLIHTEIECSLLSICLLFQKHVFGTVASIILPALLAKGTVLYEEGANFIHGENRENMIEDSPDGSIVILAVAGDDNDDIVLEIKCPYPDDTTLDVHYKIPVYYAVQLLSHMKSKDMNRCWYTSYSEQSVVVLELKMQEDVWRKCLI